MDLVTFHIATGLFGPFVLPSKCQASPYYWIGVNVSGSYHFQKPVQVEFEHFGACDPSHYQLLCCEDDDESYTMQPVDYELSFSVRGNISWCTFHTNHFLCVLHVSLLRRRYHEKPSWCILFETKELSMFKPVCSIGMV